MAVLMPEMRLPSGALRDQNGAGAQAEAPGDPAMPHLPQGRLHPNSKSQGHACRTPREGREEDIDLGMDGAVSKECRGGSCSL